MGDLVMGDREGVFVVGEWLGVVVGFIDGAGVGAFVGAVGADVVGAFVPVGTVA